MNQQVDRIKNYEQKLQFTLNKLEPQYRLPTENSINNASQIGGILKQSHNNNQNYIQFLESITPQSKKSNQFNRSFMVERQNTDQEQMKDNILPQINNPRSKSENKNGAHNNNSQQYYLDQQKQNFYNNRQSSSKNQKRSHNYNFYAQPKNAIEVTIKQNEFESTNSSNLWNDLQMKKPNYRYPNTTKYSQSNKITLQQSNDRQLQSRDLIRSLTIDNKCDTSSNSKSRNYLDDLSIYNKAVNRLDTSSSQMFNQPLSKHMINIKNLVKNQSLTPISQATNNSRLQELQINTNDNNDNYSNLRLSNQCFSTPHKSYYKDLNSKMLLNKSYDYDLKIKSPILHKTKTNEKSIQTELKELQVEQNDLQLNENIIKNENIQISLNRNHLKNISSSSNRYSKHNYNLASPQVRLQQQQYNKHQQINIQSSHQGRMATDSEIQSNRSNLNNLSFHHTSVSKNQYLIDERKVVSIQVQNAEMDQYIRQIQKYVFKKQHDIDNNSSLSFKRPNVIHPSDLAQQVFNHQMKSNQLLNDLQHSNSNQDLMQTLMENDIHSEQPLTMQQHTFQHQNQDQKQLLTVDQNLHQNYPKEGIDVDQQDKNHLEKTDSQHKNKQQKRSSKDIKEIQQVQKDDLQDKCVEKQNNNQMNETIARQYSFSACYNQNKVSLPQSRNSEQVDQTPKLNSQEKLQIPSQKYSLDEGSSQENQPAKQEETDFFDKKRSAEFGINYNSHKNSQAQIKNSSHQQLNTKNTQLELLQENTQQQINQNPQYVQNQNSSKGLSKNLQYITQTAQLSSQKSSNQSSYNSTQSYQIINQQSSQSSKQQSSQSSNQPCSQNSQQQSQQNSQQQSQQNSKGQSQVNSQEQSQFNSQEQSSLNSGRQLQQDNNRLSSQGSKFASQNSNNFSPYNCSKTKLLENNQQLDSQRVKQQQQQQQQDLENIRNSQNKFMQFNPNKTNQIIITQEAYSNQLSKRNSNQSNKQKQIQFEENKDSNFQEGTRLQQKNIQKTNQICQPNQNEIQNYNKQINLDHNQISLPGAAASALESHQTVSQQSSKKNSVSQQFYQGLFSNTLRKDPSFQNSDSHPNQFKQEGSPFSSNQDSQREQLNKINEDFHQEKIQNVQLQQNRENGIQQSEQISLENNKKQDILLNQSQQNGFQNHQFYEKERRKLNAQIQQQQKYKKKDKMSEADQITTQAEKSNQNQYPNDSRYIQKQIFHKEAQENLNKRSQNRQIEFLTTATDYQDNQSQRKKRFNTVENEGRYIRTDSQDSSQWLRENIIMKNESPIINQANSTQKSFKSRSKDSTLQSFYQSNMFNIINIGGSVEDPIKIVKKCNEFKKQGYIKLSYKETQFVNSQRKSNQLTPKKKSLNKVSISPTRNQDSNVTSINTSHQSKVQSKTKLINSSEISFQSPNKFNVSKQS